MYNELYRHCCFSFGVIQETRYLQETFFYSEFYNDASEDNPSLDLRGSGATYFDNVNKRLTCSPDAKRLT